MRASTIVLASLLATSAAAEGPATLELSLSVAGAKVEVDDRVVAESAPQAVLLQVTPGARTIRVTKDGFQPLVKTVDVAAGATAKVDLLLKLAEAPSGKTLRIAVQELVAGEGVRPRVTSLVSEAVLTEVRKLDRTQVVGMNEIGEMLSFEQKRQLAGCDESACLEEIGGALGVDALVTGTIGTLGGSTLFSLRRIDVRKAKVLGAVTRRFPTGTGEELLAAIGPTIEELFPELPLTVGRVRGTSLDVAERLNPPPIPRWAFFATAGAATVVAGAGVFFGVKADADRDRYDALLGRSVGESISGRELNAAGASALSNAKSANVAFGVAAGLAVVAGVEALFTDWKGYGREIAVKSTAYVVPTADGAALVGRF